jgi:hypothetical protein
VSAVPGASERPVLADGELGYQPGLPRSSDRRVFASSRTEPATPQRRPATRILADRITSALVHHEPGWRLPRHTVLARRYNVSTDEIDAAIGVLVARHIIRRLPDGQLYRASPAEYLIPLEGITGFTRIDPMGGEIACQSRHMSWRHPPDVIGHTLRAAAGHLVCVVRSIWAAGAEPAAVVTTYLAAHIGEALAAAHGVAPLGPARTLPLLQVPGDHDAEPLGEAGYSPSAVSIEMHPPPPSIARSLHLSASQPATMIAVRFDDPVQGIPAAVTVVALRPDLFRIVVQAPAASLAAEGAEGFPEAWADALTEPDLQPPAS